MSHLRNDTLKIREIHGFCEAYHKGAVNTHDVAADKAVMTTAWKKRCTPGSGVCIAGCVLIAVAMLSQAAAGKTRWGFFQPSSSAGCEVGTRHMRKIIDGALAHPAMITDAEKAFVQLQHHQFSCEDYTRLFERSNYYKSPGKREAMMKWHWEVYHSHSESGRDSAPRGVKTVPGGGW